jgi:hypothetical protein
MMTNVADITNSSELLHGEETRGWGDQAYRGQRAVIRRNAPRARDLVNRRYRHRNSRGRGRAGEKPHQIASRKLRLNIWSARQPISAAKR